MKKLIVILSSIITLAGCGYTESDIQSAYEQGKEKGYNQGYNEGFEKGKEEGYQKGYDDGILKFSSEE